MPYQDHIHLDSTLGGAPENAPTATYTAFKRLPRPEVRLSFDRAVDGTPWWGVIVDNTGDPRQFHGFRYTIRCTEAQYTALLALQGKAVYLVDHNHADDGTDHTSDVKLVLVREMSYLENVSPAVIYHMVDLTLEDLYTVAPLQ